MKITACAASWVGRRQNNEDQYLVAETLGLFAVADGMGGYSGGEVASQLAVAQLEQFVQRNRRDPQGTWPCREDKRRSFFENLLAAAALHAHGAIVAQRSGPNDQMGSTLVSVLIEGTRAIVAHVGDSRVYLLRQGQLTQLTRDHSLWAELQASGMEVGPRSEFGHKNIITRALGIPNSHRADVTTCELRPHDRLLLCSDGLHDPLDTQAISALMAGPCEALVKAAYDAGSSDNITAVLLTIE